MELDKVQVKSEVDKNGNGYTTAVSNDKLTNEDFLTMMIAELKMQDPTKPMDSASMMDNQLKMSTIESNVGMSEAMESLKNSYESSTLGAASQMMGKYADMTTTIKNDDGTEETQIKQYEIKTISQIEGALYGNVQELIGWRDTLIGGDSSLELDYNENGFIYENGIRTDTRILLNPDTNRFALDDNGKKQFIGPDGKTITDENILAKYNLQSVEMLYGEETLIPLSSITKISNTIM